MTRDAIPQLHEPFGPRTETRQYEDSTRRFGAPLARAATGDALRVGRVEEWTPLQVYEAAIAGAQDPCALEDADVARICLAYLELQQQLAVASGEAEQHYLARCAAERETHEQRGAYESELAKAAAGHFEHLRRAAASLALVSAENVQLRHRLAGTTPAVELVAQGRSPTLEDLLTEAVERHHPSDEPETVVVDIPIPNQGRTQQ